MPQPTSNLQIVQAIHGTAIFASRAHCLATKATTHMWVELMMHIHANWIEGVLTSGVYSIKPSGLWLWHGVLNGHAIRGDLSFYLMVRLLCVLVQIVNMQVCLLTDHKLK